MANNKKTNFVKLPRGGYRLGSGKDNFMNTIQVETTGKNAFDLSHGFKFTGKIANLMPCFVAETVPGDKFNLSCDILTRIAPMIAPVMDRMDVRLEYFHVPNRLVWPKSGANQGWDDFIANEPGVLRPTIQINDTLTADMFTFLDYFRVPPFSPGDVPVEIQAMPFAAYQKIYNDYYRPQYLETEIPFALTDGSNDTNVVELLKLRRRCYDNDYYTAGLPTPQKGSDVLMPGGAVTFDPTGFGTTAPTFRDSASNSLTGAVGVNASDEINIGANPNIMGYDPAGTLNAPANSINDMRTASALQKWLEMFMRAGSRMKELIKAAFNVEVEDYRVDRPEFITGVKSPVIISEVLNTTGGDPDLPQGNMAGHGVAVIEGYQDGYYAKEYGYIIGIISVMPKATYKNGLERHWLRNSPNDWYWPHFANLGEQAVQNQELCAYQSDGTQVFAYMPRYGELRTINDAVAGRFRDTLEFWTYARTFNSTPALNRDFLDPEDTDVTRTLAVTDPNEDYLFFHVYHKVTAIRPIPVYGTPQLV